ncbi:RING finger domain-containing protein [Streptomyces sp. NPDC051014]|uniref:RING finger domain-containing protein n=1 Tax=Streptomyces sp. NPDC051014 TaxID=3155751 RepID=UPI0033CB6D87
MLLQIQAIGRCRNEAFSLVAFDGEMDLLNDEESRRNFQDQLTVLLRKEFGDAVFAEYEMTQAFLNAAACLSEVDFEPFAVGLAGHISPCTVCRVSIESEQAYISCCGHGFHRDCASNAVRRAIGRPSCPDCRMGWSNVDDLVAPVPQAVPQTCIICKQEIGTGEERTMADCCPSAFHHICLKTWLDSGGLNCPSCSKAYPRTLPCAYCAQELNLDLEHIRALCNHAFHAECMARMRSDGGTICPQCMGPLGQHFPNGSPAAQRDLAPGLRGIRFAEIPMRDRNDYANRRQYAAHVDLMRAVAEVIQSEQDLTPTEFSDAIFLRIGLDGDATRRLRQNSPAVRELMTTAWRYPEVSDWVAQNITDALPDIWAALHIIAQPGSQASGSSNPNFIAIPVSETHPNRAYADFHADFVRAVSRVRSNPRLRGAPSESQIAAIINELTQHFRTPGIRRLLWEHEGTTEIGRLLESAPHESVLLGEHALRVSTDVYAAEGQYRAPDGFSRQDIVRIHAHNLLSYRSLKDRVVSKLQFYVYGERLGDPVLIFDGFDANRHVPDYMGSISIVRRGGGLHGAASRFGHSAHGTLEIAPRGKADEVRALLKKQKISKKDAIRGDWI